jgi:hypothetical protein
MKKIQIYIGVLALFTIFSCNKAKQKNEKKEDFVTMNPVVTEDTIEKKHTTHFDVIDDIKMVDRVGFGAMKGDTIVGKFKVSYMVRDNYNDVINQKAIDGLGDTILLIYPNSTAFVDITYDGQVILSNKAITKYTFNPIIPQDVIEQYQLWYFGIEKVDEDGILFSVNICIPDTSVCYPIWLYISKSGKFTMWEAELDETDDY